MENKLSSYLCGSKNRGRLNKVFFADNRKTPSQEMTKFHPEVRKTRRTRGSNFRHFWNWRTMTIQRVSRSKIFQVSEKF